MPTLAKRFEGDSAPQSNSPRQIARTQGGTPDFNAPRTPVVRRLLDAEYRLHIV